MIMPSALTQYGQKFFLGEKGVAKFLFAVTTRHPGMNTIKQYLEVDAI